ncbi:MAG: hypothetical protein KDA91_21370, partial [Planctomycetaceae bacterium]|nr:hypothetical protein [Planctomycetaceae bacterium]
RMKYVSTFRPAAVDFIHASDMELVAALQHPNDWHARMARLVLQERASNREIDAGAVERIKLMALREGEPAMQLRALWALHATGRLDGETATSLLNADSEYIRAWVSQLLTEKADPQLSPFAALIENARNESSLLVRRYLASAMQRVPPDVAWQIAEGLCSHAESNSDRDLPRLIWYGLAPLVLNDIDRALALADKTALPTITDQILWYTAAHSAEARNRIVKQLSTADEGQRSEMLSLLALAVRDQRGLETPVGWQSVADTLFASPDSQTAGDAEAIGAAVGDARAFDRIRERITSGQLDNRELRQAIQVLSSDKSPANLEIYLKLLDQPELSVVVIPQLAGFNDITIADALLDRLPDVNGRQAVNITSAMMETLCSRPAWASRILDRIAQGKLEKSQLTAFYARQMAALGDAELNTRLEQEWGRLGQSSKELKSQILSLSDAYRKAPLWAYNERNGEAHFRKLCSQCHLPNAQTEALAPRLAGSGSKGIDYLVENVIDPNAVIGRDFQARIIVTTEGRVITGLIQNENESTLTVRTLNESVTIAKAEIEEIKISESSFMPTDMLKPLNDRERIELFKYLMSL